MIAFLVVTSITLLIMIQIIARNSDSMYAYQHALMYTQTTYLKGP